MTEETVMVHVRVRKKTKDAATKVAQSLNISLSFIVEQAFRRFVTERRIVIEDSVWARRHRKQQDI